MTGDLVLITPGLSFGQLDRGEVTPSQVYERQVNDWILRPVEILRNHQFKAANGMSAFGILLMFFEPHGQYLLGMDSNRRSKKCFVAGFERFINSLGEAEKGEAPNSGLIYKWARCGLFHSTKLNTELLVDTVGMGSGIFTKIDSPDAYLCNPWRMLDHLKKYLSDYCCEIDANDNDELIEKFNITFDRLVGEAKNHFCG